MKTMLGLAISITARAFIDKVDKGGVPYILHCLYVMEHTPGDDCVKCAAVMHDLIEDTDWTFKNLISKGFSPKTLKILRLVTHMPEDPYEVYIKIIATDQDATNLKKADLQHNSLLFRLKGLTKKDFDRVEKYHRSYTYLSKI
jgi:(p)ppGpp synthase/HD superfamily hydrolase